jgi:cupin 2 domain-containing protein
MAEIGWKGAEMPIKNLFKQIPADLPEEFFESIIKSRSFKLKRIISKGHATPAGEWYDQQDNEWVLLLQGSAGLRLEGKETTTMKPGDYILLPAGLKHRVEWTDSTTETIWLALHFPV